MSAAATGGGGERGPTAPKKRVLVLGRPGAGKGTQARRVARFFDILHISTGELMREVIERDGPVGRRCDAYVSAGRLVPTLLVGNLVCNFFARNDAMVRGFVLDGFPRTRDQLQILDDLLDDHELDAAIELEVSAELVTKRLAARGRLDDEDGTIVRRLELFEEETQPMISSLRARGLLRSIDGSREEDDVTVELFSALQRTMGNPSGGEGSAPRPLSVV
jgi:adenylate kinase